MNNLFEMLKKYTVVKYFTHSLEKYIFQKQIMHTTNNKFSILLKIY